MPGARRWCAAALVLLGGARLNDTVPVRCADHHAYGRLVFDLPSGLHPPPLEVHGDVVTITLPGAGLVLPRACRLANVAAVEGGVARARITLEPDTTVSAHQLGSRLVLDVRKSSSLPAGTAGREPSPPIRPPATQPTLAGTPLPAPANAAKTSMRGGNMPLHVDLVPVGPPPPLPAPAPVTVSAAAVPPPGGAAQPPAVAPDGLRAVRLIAEGNGSGPAMLIPFDRDVGAAAFSRGSIAHIVFDDSKPVDMAGLKDDAVFGGASVTLLPAATHITLKLPVHARLQLRRKEDGWALIVASETTNNDTALVSGAGGVLQVAMPDAADTVVLEDPISGGRLLVGTVHGDDKPVLVAHHGAEFTLAPSWVGVVVVPTSDRVELRAVKAGFTVSAGSGPPLSVSIAGAAEQALADVGSLTRQFKFLPLPVSALLARFHGAIKHAAEAPPAARLRPRLEAAQNMIALGLDREAAGLIRTSLRDDPERAQAAGAGGLLAIADWLSGQPSDPNAKPPDGSSDEAALWRAIIGGPGQDTAVEGAVLAANWRVVLGYPEALRRRLLPEIEDRLARGGQLDALDSLLARAPEHVSLSARAALTARRQKPEAALALLDQAAQSPDRREAAEGGRQAIELRLALGRITPADAASSLAKHLYAWRDDATELKLRLRIADLRTQAGEWRAALALLRETEMLQPDAHDQVSAAERSVLASLLQADAGSRLAPLDLVAMIAENADLLSGKQASASLAPVLVDKLLALDLPERAAPLLEQLMVAAQAPETKAGLGARLAALRLQQRDAKGADAALNASEAASLPPADLSARTVLRARVRLVEGDDESALHVLATEESEGAQELRADIYEKRKDWVNATAALRALVHICVSATGPLSDRQQDLILRYASAATQAGDMTALQNLQAGSARLLSPGPRQDLFRALVVQPVRSLGDLARSAREADAARALPAALGSYRSH